MNIIIYTFIILAILYYFFKIYANQEFKKIKNNTRYLIVIALVLLAIFFAIAGRYLFTFPLTILSLALLKLKGLSLFQLISLFRLIRTLRNTGRFSFNQSKTMSNSSALSLSEAYEILNLDKNKKITKEDINRAYIKIQKKIHPDVSPETTKLSMIVNEARDLLLKEIK